MTNSVHLQGIGKVTAKPAGELKIGDKTVWNYGFIETIVAIELKGKSVYVTITDNRNEKFTRRFLQTRLVGITSR